MKAELIDSMGSDLSIVNAARVSMDKESEWELEYSNNPYTDFEPTVKLKAADVKLIKYLAKHNHFTPFTHCTITLRETVPIFIARQRFKHTVGFSYNEVSRRYVDDTPEFYTPSVWRKRAENVKQGSSNEEVTTLKYKMDVTSAATYTKISDEYELFLENCKQVYNLMISNGVAPEQARMVLPQSMFTSYYVTGSLYAFAHAYLLRSDPHAQVEIQELAKQWDFLIRPLYPESWKALVNTTSSL